ncbi:MAG TPA: O-antigen ligase domain-containing protein, partial [Deltaproteobacteria bacterium]|nr:O-antigen ligase domain-containing protein [Deltaproteobacteria bacterium]
YRHLIDKAFLFSAIMLCSVGMFLSTSRNALFTALTGLLFLAFPVLKKGRGLKSLLVVTSIVVVSFVVSINVIPNFANRFGRVFPAITKVVSHQSITLSDFRVDVSKDMPSRLSIWKTGIEKAMERPLLGWGNCMAYFHLKPVTKHDHLHNAFLEILYSNGTIGFALFLALIALWLAKLRSVWCWAPVAATLFMSLFETFFVIAPWVVFTAWLVAFTTRDLTENRNDSSGEDLQSPQDEGRQL